MKNDRGGIGLRALVVLPTYNEIGNLGPLLEDIIEQGSMFHVLVIDDGSPDGTGLLADHYREMYPDRVAVIHRQGKLGLATAYLTGFRYGLAQAFDVVLEMDADFSHNPAYLPRLVNTLVQERADVVLGSRYVPGGGSHNWPWYRKWVSRGGSWYAGWMLGLPQRDLTGGFKCFRREVLEELDFTAIQATGYGFQIEMTYRAVQQGFRVVEAPIMFEERREGVSKMSTGILAEAFWMVARLRAQSLWGLQPEREPKGERTQP